MELETLLNAMVATHYSVDWPARIWEDDDLPEDTKILKHRRQYRAFRDRILLEFAEKDAEIERLRLKLLSAPKGKRNE